MCTFLLVCSTFKIFHVLFNCIILPFIENFGCGYSYIEKTLLLSCSKTATISGESMKLMLRAILCHCFIFKHFFLFLPFPSFCVLFCPYPFLFIPSMSSNWSPKTKIGIGDGRISGLLDSLLLHILPFLQTKDVVVTSLLSKGWRTLWRFIHQLDFDSEASPSFSDLWFIWFDKYAW